MKKLKLLIVLFTMLFIIPSFSQGVAINSGGASPNSNAMLDISSTTKGLLIPRLTTVQRTGISFTVSEDGLTVYDTDTKCYWLWDGAGATWSRFSMGGNSWFLAGNGSTDPTNDFIGTIDAKDLVFKTNNTEKVRLLSGGNVGIGTSAPDGILELNMGTNKEFRLSYNDADGSATDYAKFEIEDDGMLTITTVDNDATEADIILAPDGNVGIGISTPIEKLDVDGNIKLSGEVNRTSQGSVDLIPFAYGIVNVDGTIRHAGTGNWTSSRSSVGKYTIVITSGGPYDANSHMTQVSGRNLYVGTTSNDVRIISFGQIGNDLRVYSKDGDGDFASSEFHFIIYKP